MRKTNDIVGYCLTALANARTARLSILAACLLPLTSFATTLQYQSFDDLVAKADGILQATISTVVSRRDSKSGIFTFVTLNNLEVIKGHYAGATFTLRMEGGEVDGEVLELEGAPEFRKGERVLLFVRGNGKYSVPVVGWTQGVFRISANANGTESVLDHDGNLVVDVSGKALLKEQRFAPRSRIVGQGSAAVSESEASLNSAGTGKQPTIDQSSVARTNSARELRADAFLELIRSKLRALPVAKASVNAEAPDLESVETLEGEPPTDQPASSLPEKGKVPR